MILAGVRISDPLVRDLADRLRDYGFDAPAETLELALASGRAVVALSISDREAILRVLDDSPEALAELRGCAAARTRVACSGRIDLGVRVGGVLRRGEFAS